MGNFVITLTEDGTPSGQMEKMEAHSKGIFHLAFSILVINDHNEVLLQKRASGKYHSSGLWSNTCCSHPVDPSEIEQYAHKRLQEEMGFDCPLKHCGYFDYRVEFDNHLIEHERDHVYIGIYNDDPDPDEEEAGDYQWMGMEELEKELLSVPEKYSFWLPMVFDIVRKSK
jgi:isopentenyl-diphosphate delta-isomerase